MTYKKTLNTYELSKLNQGGVKNLNRLIVSNKIEAVAGQCDTYLNPNLGEEAGGCL